MKMSQATARAGANIALVKYWGKRATELNLPATGSISITLDELVTRTTVTPDPDLDADELMLDGTAAVPARVSDVLDLMRELSGREEYCRVESTNSFPTGAGLASSAAGFAALVVAADGAFGLELPPERLSELARRGSGSAARSIFGGFVEMDAGERDDGADAVARPLLAPGDWPLEVVVAITESGFKLVSSTDGMNHTMATSPYYRAWVESVPPDLEQARQAIAMKDFDRLAEVAEYSAMKMHASALAARPALLYWNPATLACLEEIRNLRAEGVEVFFTIDAGPQVKAICQPGHAGHVVERLRIIEGVARVMRTGLGEGARVVT